MEKIVSASSLGTCRYLSTDLIGIPAYGSYWYHYADYLRRIGRRAGTFMFLDLIIIEQSNPTACSSSLTVLV